MRGLCFQVNLFFFSSLFSLFYTKIVGMSLKNKRVLVVSVETENKREKKNNKNCVDCATSAMISLFCCPSFFLHLFQISKK